MLRAAETVQLAHGHWEVELRPAVGGAIASLRRRGVDLLRPMPAGTANPLDAACFPLVPYCNRIGEARFAFAGRRHRLPPNFPPEPHSLHGIGWQRPWQPIVEGTAQAVLACRHAGGNGWPWPFVAEQRIALGPHGCSITLWLHNLADEPAPAGLGLHPYVRRRPETCLRFEAASALLAEPGSVPDGARAPADHFGDWRKGAALPHGLVDHCHADWAGEVVISDDLGAIRMTATGTPHLHLYAPPRSDILCCEPVNHLPDALNGVGPMPILPPGGEARIEMRIGVA